MSETSLSRTLSTSEDDLRRLARLLRRHAWLIVGCALLGGALGLANASLTKPTYTAHAQLLLSPRPVAPLQTSDNFVTFDAPYVDSQIVVLKSGALAREVVDALRLGEDAEFASPNDPRDPRLLEDFGKRLSVTRDGMSYAINIAFTSRDPAKAAKIANAVAEAFISAQIGERSQQVKQRQEWLEGRIATIRRQLNDANHAVQTLKSRGDFSIPEPTTDHESLDILEAKAATYKKLLEAYLYAQAESSQEQTLALTNARVITPAVAPLESNTKTRWLVLLGGFAGAVLGGGLAAAGDVVRIHHLLSRLRSDRARTFQWK